MTLRKGTRIVLAWLLLVAGAGVPGAVPPAPATAAAVENLTYEATDVGIVVRIRTSTPVPRFVCSLPGALREVTLDLPEASSHLQSSYALGNPLVPEVRVQPKAEGGPGVVLRLILGSAALSRVEQVGDGLILRFVGVPAGASTVGPPASQEYKVGPGDKLEIAVFDHPELSQVVEVRGDGTINYPMIGDLQVSGKTIPQIDDEITKILGTDYLVNPQVTVDVREYLSQWVNVVGEVRSPGRYVLKRNMRLIDLLAEAGGVTKDAGSEILITRHAQGQEGQAQTAVDLEQLFSRSNAEVNLPLLAGDVISVGEKSVFYIRGEVTRPGAYVLERGMTVLKAISVAGGFGQFANPKEVELLRAGEHSLREKRLVNVKAIENGKGEDISLRANDIIIVPRRIF